MHYVTTTPLRQACTIRVYQGNNKTAPNLLIWKPRLALILTTSDTAMVILALGLVDSSDATTVR